MTCVAQKHSQLIRCILFVFFFFCRAGQQQIHNTHTQFEQRKFLQQHKLRADSYSKAAATMKKQRKKKNNAQNADKEIKVNKNVFILT